MLNWLRYLTIASKLCPGHNCKTISQIRRSQDYCDLHFFTNMRNFYKIRFKYFFVVHILSLLITGIVSTITVYQKYTYGKVQKDFVSDYKKFEDKSPVLRSYYRYTGTETGFGFFAPNVKGQGTLFFESCGTLLDLPFETNEGNIRSNCMISSVTDYIKEELEKKDKSPTLKHKFSDLLIQNLVAKVRQVNGLDNECTMVQVNYKLVEFPPLNATVSTKQPQLFDIKTWIYETKN